MSFDRTDRVSEELKKELAALIPNLKDPRISGMCSVISATVTKDFKFAKAYISVLGTDIEKEDTIKGLNSAAGFVRKEIGRALRLRYTPEISFELDSSIEYGAHISKLLSDIEKR